MIYKNIYKLDLVIRNMKKGRVFIIGFLFLVVLFSINFILAPNPIVIACGDNSCNGDETYLTCPSDCDEPAPTVVCGDGICDWGEDLNNCPGDCSTNCNFDGDGDGYGREFGSTFEECISNEIDCDDGDEFENPGADQICGNAIDERTCLVIDDTCPPTCTDGDGDGWGSPASPACLNGNSLDCDDRPNGADGIAGNADDGANINPGATETCDGIDNNCDGDIDEDISLNVFYRDSDGDGYGDLITTILSCSASLSPEYVIDYTDCDDNEPSANPGLGEAESDNIDNDCDGLIDEGFPADDACWIDRRVDCEARAYTSAMGLSGYTNAHGQLEDQTPANPVIYDYVLCCNFGQIANNCNDGTEILSLSSPTNAHAEVASEESYLSSVCYKPLGAVNTLVCEAGTTSPDPTYNAILSLSDTTNAHIGGPGPEDYLMKIWCNIESANPPFSYCAGGAPNGARDAGEECDPDIDGTGAANCDNLCICDDAYDPHPDPNLNLCIWTGSAFEDEYWAEDYGFALTGTGLNDGTTYSGPVHVGYTEIFMSVIGKVGLSGDAIGELVTFEIYEDDFDLGTGWGDDRIRVGMEAIEGLVVDIGAGQGIGNWTPTSADLEKTAENDWDFYFKAYDKDGNELTGESPPRLTFGSVTSILCGSIGLCLDYKNGADCNKDINLCQVGEFSVNLNSPNINCDDPGVTCDCWWDTSTSNCGARWENSGGICTYEEDTDDTCDDLFITYTANATWTGTGDAPAECQDGLNVVPCPTQIPLPFFNIYNLIALIVIIILIYFLMHLKKKKVSVRKRRKKK